MANKAKNFGNKINTNGFDKRPKDAKKGGRKPSIRKAIEVVLGSGGSLFIPMADVTNLEAEREVDGQMIQGIEVDVPTDLEAAILLTKWMRSSNGRTSLDAIKLAMDQIDGKAVQPISHEDKQVVHIIIEDTDLHGKPIKSKIPDIEKKWKTIDGSPCDINANPI